MYNKLAQQKLQYNNNVTQRHIEEKTHKINSNRAYVTIHIRIILQSEIENRNQLNQTPKYMNYLTNTQMA